MSSGNLCEAETPTEPAGETQGNIMISFRFLMKSNRKTQHYMCFARLRHGKQVLPTKVSHSYMHVVPTQFKYPIIKISSTANAILLILIIERETGLEPAASTLARWRSTN